jgi:hypothetical protein
MSKIFIITFVTLMTLSSLGVYAQDKSEAFDKESFLIKRKAFITSELSLTPYEVEQFIPLVEELQQQKFEAGHRCRKLTRELRQKENPSDTEYLKAIDVCLGVGLKEAELEKEYYEKFKKILSPAKLYKYKEVEFKFAREFFKNPKEQERARRSEVGEMLR